MLTITPFKNILSREVWALAWPMILSNASIPLLGMVDTAVVGHLSAPNDIAAIALGTMIFDVLFWCFGFLRMSTTALAAQEPDRQEIYYQSSLIAVLIGCVLMLATPLFNPLLLLMIHTKPEVEQLVMSYFGIRIFSAIPTLLNYVNYGFFFGRHNTKTPLFLLLFTNGLAMLLDYLLVWEWHLGANGIALANCITQTIGAVLGGLLIYRRYLKPAQPPSQKSLLSWARTKQLFSLNADIFLRTLCLVLTTAFFTRQSAALGVGIVAANLILMNLQLFTSFALDGFAIAAESLVGRAIGNNNHAEFWHQVKACAAWSLLFGSILALFYCVFGHVMIQMLTSIKTVQAFAFESLGWVICLPLIAVPGFLLDGVYIGAAWSKPLRNSVLFASLLVFLPIWYCSRPYGNQGLWFAYTSFIFARGCYLLTHLKSHWV